MSLFRRLSAPAKPLPGARKSSTAHLASVLTAARKRGRVGGRPKRIDAAALKKACALLASGDYTRAEVAAELHVSQHTLWRELARAAV